MVRNRLVLDVSSTATPAPTVTRRTLSEATEVPKGEGEEGEDGSPPNTKTDAVARVRVPLRDDEQSVEACHRVTERDDADGRGGGGDSEALRPLLRPFDLVQRRE